MSGRQALIGTVQASAVLRRLEGRARQLLADVGAVGEQYDSGRVVEAMGRLSEAVAALQAARMVAAAQGLRIGRPRKLPPLQARG